MTVMGIARETGWSESEILALPMNRINTYVRALNEIAELQRASPPAKAARK